MFSYRRSWHTLSRTQTMCGPTRTAARRGAATRGAPRVPRHRHTRAVRARAQVLRVRSTLDTASTRPRPSRAEAVSARITTPTSSRAHSVWESRNVALAAASSAARPTRRPRPCAVGARGATSTASGARARRSQDAAAASRRRRKTRMPLLCARASVSAPTTVTRVSRADIASG